MHSHAHIYQTYHNKKRFADIHLEIAGTIQFESFECQARILASFWHDQSELSDDHVKVWENNQKIEKSLALHLKNINNNDFLKKDDQLLAIFVVIKTI